jgi:hypothetical protein
MKYTIDEEPSPKKRTIKRKRTTKPAILQPIPKLVIPRFQLTAILSLRQAAPITPPPPSPPTARVVSPPPTPPPTTESPMDTSNITVVSMTESFTKDYLPDIDNLTQTVPPLPSPTTSMIGLAANPPEVDPMTIFLSFVPPVRRLSF